MSSDEDEWDGGARAAAAPAAANYPVLKGRLKLNDESHLVFLGIWNMKLAAKEDSKTKFKLKSTKPVSSNFLSEPSSSVTLNGFFHTDASDIVEPYRKIKERDVTINFKKTGPSSYLIKGKGTNDFGIFRIEGNYQSRPANKDKIHWLQCKKVYGSGDEEYDDDDISDEDDNIADEEELNGLEEDAQLSVEELRKKYQQAASNSEEKPPAAKKQKT
jgi:hypothetical protein